MDLYILRHGIAEEREAGRDDASRALTPKGRERLRLTLEAAARAGVHPALILTSPYVRAVQTAEMASRILDCRKIERTDALLPDSSPQAVWEDVRARRFADSVLLTGHEPLLSATASFLLGAAWTLVELKKGALACLNVEDEPRPHGLLRWLFTAKLAAGGRTSVRAGLPPRP
jgi:phosphohistidine phosphatase